ncbi:MAG: hypothetical protein NVSMB2_01870 [Chloroflexota bacterium]
MFALADLVTPDADHSRRWEIKNRLLRRTGLRVGYHTAVSRGFRCYNPRRVVIEEHVAIGENAHFFNFGSMRVGAFTTLAQDVSIANGWHATTDLAPDSGPLTIGRGAWIGLGARLIGSITVGDYCIVGAGSVVVDDLPARSISVGSPARVIGYRELAATQWHFRSVYFDTATFEILPGHG